MLESILEYVDGRPVLLSAIGFAFGLVVALCAGAVAVGAVMLFCCIGAK